MTTYIVKYIVNNVHCHMYLITYNFDDEDSLSFFWSLDQIEWYFFYLQWYKKISKFIKVKFRKPFRITELQWIYHFIFKKIRKFVSFLFSKTFSYLVDIKWYHKRNWRSTLIYYYCVCMLIFIPFKQFQNLQSARK